MNLQAISRPVSKRSFGTGLLRHMIPALTLALTLASPPAFADGGPEATEARTSASLEGLGEVLDILASNPMDSSSRGIAIAHLAAKGPRTVGAIHALIAGTAPIPNEALEKGPVLTLENRTVLFDAMRSWDSRRVAEKLLQVLETYNTSTDRIVAIRILGEVGNARSVDTFLEIIEAFDPIEFRHPAIRRPAVEALARAFERDPLSYVVMSTGIQKLPREQLDFVVDAISRAGRAEGVELLEGLLDREPQLDEKILCAMCNLGVREISIVGHEVGRLARSYLSATHAGTRREAVRALGTLHDANSFIELTELLDDPDSGVATAALSALQNMSHTAWPADPARWQRWYYRERKWLQERATALSGELEIGDPEAAMKAIRELVSHPLFRTEMVNTIGRAADHADRAVAVLACESLGHLNSPEAIELLIEALYDPREGVREAAAESLRLTTGQTLPADAQTWRSWLQS